MLIYCDTNIFIDLYRGRNDPIRPLKDFAFEFFKRGEDCHFNLIISEWLEKELKNHLKEEEVKEIFERFRCKNKLVFVKQEKDDWNKAKQLSKDHPDDALHAILANRAHADYLTTRNVEHFAGCEHLVKVVFPEFI